MTASQLQDLILRALIKEVGGNQRRWRIALGQVRVLDATKHSHCNWAVTPMGSSPENHAIETLLDRIRAEHPIVSQG